MLVQHAGRIVANYRNRLQLEIVGELPIRFVQPQFNIVCREKLIVGLPPTRMYDPQTKFPQKNAFLVQKLYF